MCLMCFLKVFLPYEHSKSIRKDSKLKLDLKISGWMFLSYEIAFLPCGDLMIVTFIVTFIINDLCDWSTNGILLQKKTHKKQKNKATKVLFLPRTAFKLTLEAQKVWKWYVLTSTGPLWEQLIVVDIQTKNTLQNLNIARLLQSKLLL